MNLKILKKDLKRKKSMNLILTLFVFLASMFIAASINNLVVIVNGTEYFFDAAGLGDYFVLTMRGNYGTDRANEDGILNELSENSLVEKVTEDDIVFLAKNNVLLMHQEPDINSSIIVNSCKIYQQCFFDEKNQKIMDMDDGTIYLPPSFMDENHLVKGDVLNITAKNGWNRKFMVAGAVKDALLGSDMMGSLRFVISESDFDSLLKEGGLPVGSLFSVNSSNSEQLMKEMNRKDFFSMFADGRELVKKSYIIDTVIAAVLLLVSICLILISIVMLRFLIIFTVNEDYKEIGIMKAIGIKDKRIRSLYVTKYFVMAFAGAVAGFAGSIPFGNMLLHSVSKHIVMEQTTHNLVLSLVSCIVVTGIIILFAYAGTGRIGKMSPMDAIRNGNAGERYNRKSMISLAASKWKVTTFLAVNDVLSGVKKYMVLMVTGIVGIWLVTMPVNTINTLQSEEIARWFSLLDCDVYIQNDEEISECIVKADRQAFVTCMEGTKSRLTDHGMDVERVFMEVLFRFNIRKGENMCKSIGLQGIGTKAQEYVYEEGQAPMYENEVALTYATAEGLDARIGDTVYITNYGEERPYLVTGFYQTLNNMGQGIRFHENADVDYGAAGGAFAVQVVLKNKPDKGMEQAVIEEIRDIFQDSVVYDVREFAASLLGNVAKQLESLKFLLLALVLIINVLVVVLMQKMFMIKERGEIGIMRACGISNSAIVMWQTKRIAFVLFVGVLLGVLTGIPFSQITSGRIFQMMGASKIEFVVRPLEVYVGYPFLIYVITVAACVLVTGNVRRITVQDIDMVD